MKMFVAALSVAIAIATPSVSASQHLQDDANHLIDIWLDTQKDYENMPAIMGVVVNDQDTVWSGAFGQSNLASSQQAQTTTMSSICSISKVFTETAIMKLVDDGKLKLDENVADILPQYGVEQAYPSGGNVTVASLLSHSSGVPRDTNHHYWSPPEHHFPSAAELYTSIKGAKTSYAVGEDVAYSNVGYALLGQIIEARSGSSYKSYLESNLFQPLSMHNSAVELPLQKLGKQHALGYTALDRQGARSQAYQYQTRAMQGAAGISTTVLDLAEFAKWQFRLADSKHKDILTPSSLKSMYQASATGKAYGVERGYGYQVSLDKQGNRWVEHGGMCPGYVSYLKMDVTNKMAYAVMVNANQVRALAYVNGLIDIMHKVQVDTGLMQANSNKVSLDDYTGFYDVRPWNNEFYVSKWGDGLAVLHFPAQSLRYFLHYEHVQGDTFRQIENGKPTGETVEFLRDGSGKVVSILDGGQEIPIV